MKQLLILAAVTACMSAVVGCETTRSWWNRGGGMGSSCSDSYNCAPSYDSMPTYGPGVSYGEATYGDAYVSPPSVEALPGPVVN